MIWLVFRVDALQDAVAGQSAILAAAQDPVIVTERESPQCFCSMLDRTSPLRVVDWPAAVEQGTPMANSSPDDSDEDAVAAAKLQAAALIDSVANDNGVWREEDSRELQSLIDDTPPGNATRVIVKQFMRALARKDIALETLSAHPFLPGSR